MLTFIFMDKNATKYELVLPDPDWIKDYTKIHNVTVRRAMSGRIRTYVVRDRKYAHAITYNMQFQLHRDEVRRLKKFIRLSDGHYIWVHGLDSSCGALVLVNASANSRKLKIGNATGSINVGDYLRIDGHYAGYSIVGVTDNSLTTGQPLQYTVYAGMTVDVIKIQMGIINNQEISFGSDGRAAGDEDDPENSGHLQNVEDETYNITLSVLVIKT
jgi:hypothetical protein